MYDRLLLLPDLQEILDQNDPVGLREFCEALHPGVVAEVVSGLDGPDIWRVLSSCDPAVRADIFEFLSLPLQEQLAADLDRAKLSGLVEEMAPDDRVDLLGRLKPDLVEKLLPLIPPAEQRDIRKLLAFEEQTAGAIMTTEFASLRKGMTVGEVLDELRRRSEGRETIYYLYVTDDAGHLDGILSLRELILSPADRLIDDILSAEVIAVRVDDDQEVVAQELAKYDLLAIPVVDDQRHLVGIITHDDVLDVLQEEATEDAYMQGAVGTLEDGYLDTPLLTLAWKRGVWLVFLSVVALVTAEVLNHYEHVSGTYVWMVLFLPLVLASGGNAGSQSATLVIRTLALGELSQGENVKMAWRELLVGLTLGLTLALIGFSAGLLWFGLTPTQCGVVALTVLVVVTMGTVCGALLPIGFRRLGMDPALMSNPLIAALVDVFGVLIYYTVALTILGGVAK